MTLSDLEAAWDRAHNEHHALLVEYENELADRVAFAKAVILQELQPLDEKVKAADAAKQAAFLRLMDGRAEYPGRPDCPATVDPKEIPL